MIPICCQQCGGLLPYTVQSDRLFKCRECGDLLDHRDIDLDGNEVWVVDEAGTLGYVTDPAESLNLMEESLYDYMEAPHGSAAEIDSLRYFVDVVHELRDALAHGLPFPSGR